MEPKRHLGQLYRHWDLINTVDAPLEHHATDNVLIVKLIRIVCPALVLRVTNDLIADSVNPLCKRRKIWELYG